MPDPAGPPRTTANTAQVIKKLNAGTSGTQRYRQEYGDALVCVRYRHNPDSGKRYTTVELVVDEREYIPNSRRIRIQDETQVGVHIGFLEAEARSKAKEAGAKWDVHRKIWALSRFEWNSRVFRALDQAQRWPGQGRAGGVCLPGVAHP